MVVAAEGVEAEEGAVGARMVSIMRKKVKVRITRRKGPSQSLEA